MREETITAVWFSPILRHELVVRLTFALGEGPRPDIERWFLLGEELSGYARKVSISREPDRGLNSLAPLGNDNSPIHESSAINLYMFAADPQPRGISKFDKRDLS